MEGLRFIFHFCSLFVACCKYTKFKMVDCPSCVWAAKNMRGEGVAPAPLYFLALTSDSSRRAQHSFVFAAISVVYFLSHNFKNSDDNGND